jgi:hypothetical protein
MKIESLPIQKSVTMIKSFLVLLFPYVTYKVCTKLSLLFNTTQMNLDMYRNQTYPYLS